jgi:hypothetical protein
MQDDCTQASIWIFNAWGASDGLLDVKQHADLILRLSHVSAETDTIKLDVDAMVKKLRDKLRDEKRTLVKAERERVKQQAKADAKANASAKTIEEAEASAIREEATTPQQTVKRKSKKQLIAEARAV